MSPQLEQQRRRLKHIAESFPKTFVRNWLPSLGCRAAELGKLSQGGVIYTDAVIIIRIERCDCYCQSTAARSGANDRSTLHTLIAHWTCQSTENAQARIWKKSKKVEKLSIDLIVKRAQQLTQLAWLIFDLLNPRGDSRQTRVFCIITRYFLVYIKT